jgi:hypothetical protein
MKELTKELETKLEECPPSQNDNEEESSGSDSNPSEDNMEEEEIE